MAKSQGRPSIDQLKRAISIAEKIKALETELASLVGGSLSASSLTGKRRGRPPTVKVLEEGADAGATPKKSKGSGRKKRVMSEEARKKIADAQKKRWANARSAK